MLIVPLLPVPSQIITVALGNQRCRLAVYQRSRFDITPMPNPILLTTDTNVALALDDGTLLDLSAGTATAGSVVVTPQMFLDLYINDALTLAGVPCMNAVGIVRNTYLGFAGELVFLDTQGTADPYYDGLGSRWVLGWVEA